YGRAPETRPHPRAFDLSGLVDEVAYAVGLNKHPQIRFENRVPTDFDLVADPDQLFRVLQNLVRNAAEALGEEEGQIDIWAEYRGNDALIEVRDTGPGIPKSARENLFKPFKGSARTGGTGLGLASARELVEAHEGEITLVKSDDRGTIFCISLPHKVDIAAQ
ncbi:MAG: ATP-binding protein, partial [Alphaproteobacteria bacterium]|nr:ATP-binding protein [Alphaproteobacteria bacterium]